ncbi:MAG TPA: secretin N-terminal domain-containing protein [Pyrinomonadaceae bacterium]|jgi:general secretion pathway protein D
MKTSIRVRSLAALLVTFCLLIAPMTAFAKKGEKNYKQGLQFEAAQQWDRAAQEFSLAVAADPANMEYQLHLRRALFNASQMYMIQGRSLAEQRDYIGAYNAFRQAYGYDPVNQLALSEMDRMLRLQSEKEGASGANGNGQQGSGGTPSRVAPASYQGGGATPAGRGSAPQQDPSSLVPRGTVTQRTVIYNGDLKSYIRSLADQLNINVIFDSQSFRQPRNIEINLRDVTTAQALDYIFLQEGLFFQKLSRRTILVADQTRRPQFQQLVIRTFYLSNVKPGDAQKLIQTAIPPQQGRPQTIVIADPDTNSLTVRDTSENVNLIGDLIASIDKDRAEVVMDVNIYEVSRTDLLAFGNQLGTDTALLNLGGLQRGLSAFLGDRSTAFTGVPTAAGAALVIPSSVISALQRKDRTKLLASTQIHAFNGEESSARIGQRVPVQTAQTFPFGTTNTTPGTGTGTGVNTGVGFGGGFPVFNYEPTGLTLKFTPQVFPNLDVQVKMSIESKDVLNPGSLTPTFTERTITGTARIQNNRTMMLASVAQDKQSQGRAGIPLLGLIPILGRLFSTPRRDAFQTDVVIAVTPRVLRAPAVTPRDEEQRPSGTLQTPTTGSLEALLEDANREEQQIAATAAARRIPNNVVVQLPDAEPPSYVPAPRALAGAVSSAPTASPNTSAQGNEGNATMARASGNATPVNIPAVASGQALPVATSLSNAVAPAASVNNNNAAAPAVQSLALPGSVDVAEKLRAMLGGQPTTSPNFTGGNVQVETALRALDAPPPPPERNAVAATPTMTPPPAAASAQPSQEGAKIEAAVKTAAATPVAELRLMSERQEMRVGEKQRLALVLTTNASLGTALLAMRFDARSIAVRGIAKGPLGAQGTSPTVMHSIDPNGMLLISVSPSADAPLAQGSHVLLYLDIEALAAGESRILFDQGNMYINASDGRGVQLKVMPGRLMVLKQ